MSIDTLDTDSSLKLESIFTWCDGIYNEAFEANSCAKILLQIGSLSRAGEKGFSYSPVFYHTACQAMYRAAFMDIAKIYDNDSKSITLQKVLSECNKPTCVFPDEITKRFSTTDGDEEIIKAPIEVSIHREDISLLTKYPDLTFQCRQFECLCEGAQIDKPLEYPLIVSSKQLFRIFTSQLNQMNPIIERVKTHRNKRFAHNDKDYNFDYNSLIREGDVTLGDIEKLALFALRVTTKTIELIKGESRALQFFNVDDLTNTLRYVHANRKSKD